MIHTDLTLLKPVLQTKIMAALEEMRGDAELKRLGVTGIAVSETLRELSVQMAYYSRTRMSVPDVKAMYKAAGLYAIGDAEAKRAATWTLDSKHLRGEAVDIVPTNQGSYWWAAPSEVWKRMGEIGQAHGLTWGGSWKNTDCPHYELPN
jgi:hypothetical protein